MLFQCKTCGLFTLTNSILVELYYLVAFPYIIIILFSIHSLDFFFIFVPFYTILCYLMYYLVVHFYPLSFIIIVLPGSVFILFYYFILF